MTDHIRLKVRSLPLTSGVYLMKDAAGTIIYIGKAVSLRRRVESYFRGNHKDQKTQQLVENIVDLDIVNTHSEAEALLLEAALVKEHMPKYNVLLKDGKSYPYIQITNDEYPVVCVVRLARDEEKNKKFRYFGPYTDVALIREALQIIRKIFPFCTCLPLPKKACLYYDIGLCPAPCVGKISKEDYRRTVRHIGQILNGEKDNLYRDLKEEMEQLASEKNFEAAAHVRDQLRAIGALYSSSPDVNYFKEAEQLERAFKLPRRPERIECIDISNTMGNQTTGSLVSFHNGKPDKSNYRRFRIKQVQGIDDFRSVAEVVRRRYGRLKREGLPYPDLVMIDGGKGQLAAAQEELKKLEIDIPLVSLAKREEWVFLPNKRNPVVMSKDSLGLKLLMRVRDEAHRFAVKYHRLLRDKNFMGE